MSIFSKNNTNSFEKKYLKYKNKYLTLKKLLGGCACGQNCKPGECEEENSSHLVAPVKNPIIKLFIKAMSGKNFEIDISEHSSIAMLKQNISTVAADPDVIPERERIVMWRGTTFINLEDSRTIESYGIINEEELDMLILSNKLERMIDELILDKLEYDDFHLKFFSPIEKRDDYWFLALEKAQEDKDSLRNLIVIGYCYLHGFEGIPKNIDEGIACLVKVAKDPSATDEEASFALRMLSTTYLLEQSHRNNELSIKYLREASDKGNAKAQVRLANIYTDAITVKKDLVTAFNLLKTSADNGNVRAQREIAEFYLKGYGVAINKDMAIEYLAKAVKQGDYESKFSLEKILTGFRSPARPRTKMINVNIHKSDGTILVIPIGSEATIKNLKRLIQNADIACVTNQLLIAKRTDLIALTNLQLIGKFDRKNLYNLPANSDGYIILNDSYSLTSYGIVDGTNIYLFIRE